MPNPRSETRDRIVESAANLIWSRGYSATGIQEILRASGATSGSLYHFFGSKEELLEAILERRREELRERIAAPAFASTDDPVERVFAVLELYRRHLEREGCALGCPIGNLAAELADSHPGVRRRLAALFDDWTGAIEQCLRAAAPRLPQGTDPSGLAQFVLSVMEGGVLQARTARRLEPFDASVGHLRAYFRALEEKTLAGRPASPSNI